MELKTNVNGYDVITMVKFSSTFETWIRDKEGKVIDIYKCKGSMSFERFHNACVERFKKEMGW